MKRVCIYLLCAMLTMGLYAQETDFLPITIEVEQMVEPFPPTAETQLKNKLTRLLTENGIVALEYGQFVLTAFVIPQNKDVLSSAPMKIAETMEVALYIVDRVQQVVLATTTFTIQGIGETETRCYANALKKLQLNSPAVTRFLQNGKQKIIAYYDHEAEHLIQQSQFLSATKRYEEALSILVAVPPQSSKYAEVLSVALDIYQQYIDNQCVVNLSKARQVWMAEQNSVGAQKAGEYLVNILPDAGCYEEAMALYREIKSKVLEDWHFEMQQYQDHIDIDRLRIGAMREVGVAYGKGQQPTTTNLGFLR